MSDSSFTRARAIVASLFRVLCKAEDVDSLKWEECLDGRSVISGPCLGGTLAGTVAKDTYAGAVSWRVDIHRDFMDGDKTKTPIDSGFVYPDADPRDCVTAATEPESEGPTIGSPPPAYSRDFREGYRQGLILAIETCSRDREYEQVRGNLARASALGAVRAKFDFELRRFGSGE